MITVQIRPESLKIRGHAGYAPSGLDIVCAGVTALTQTLIHSIEALTHDNLIYSVSPGRVDIDLRNLSKRSHSFIDSFFVGICDVANEFPDYVRIE